MHTLFMWLCCTIVELLSSSLPWYMVHSHRPVHPFACALLIRRQRVCCVQGSQQITRCSAKYSLHNDPLHPGSRAGGPMGSHWLLRITTSSGSCLSGLRS
ncbi:hypothetical protein GQ54DRAFT_139126 [Martensiomyces pterosporus]|nr:hypothetical protein GQ54DRAFT_139126 [Martensiomyces pterosporus]